MSRFLTLVIVLAPSLAIASPPRGPRVALAHSSDDLEWGEIRPPGETPRLERPPVSPKKLALAVNNPMAWTGFAYAASGYAAITDHQVLRVNMAWFKSAAENPGLFVLGSVISGEPIEDEAYREGGAFDVGVGWMYFPRRVWSGPTIELGGVIRTKHSYISDEYSYPEEETIDTTTTAGRALVGWHWDIRGRAFISIAAGASYGYESGTSVGVFGIDQMTVAHDVSHWKPGFEWCSRVGATF